MRKRIQPLTTTLLAFALFVPWGGMLDRHEPDWMAQLWSRVESIWSGDETSPKYGHCIDPDGQPITCPVGSNGEGSGEYGAGLDPLGSSGE